MLPMTVSRSPFFFFFNLQFKHEEIIEVKDWDEIDLSSRDQRWIPGGSSVCALIEKSKLDGFFLKAEFGRHPAAIAGEKPPTESFHTVSLWPLLWRLMQGWMRVKGGRGVKWEGRYYAAEMSCTVPSQTGSALF